MRPTLIYRCYSALAALLAPMAYRRIAPRLQAQGVAPERLRERLGHATKPRPDGYLIWFHAASVGESLSILGLIGALQEEHSDLQFLITSGTATSAQILDKRMPARCRHQFAPLDSRKVIRRFLKHWKPDLTVLVESELWPQMLVETRKRGTHLALLNARLSAKSLRNWARFGNTTKYLLSQFTMIRAQDTATYDALLSLGVTEGKLEKGPNLKALSGAVPVDETALSTMQSQIGNRPVWVAASTHNGEEETILAAHELARGSTPELLLILVPRHPERANEIGELIDKSAMTFGRRSQNQRPDGDVYLADTMGEMGLWYGLSPVVFLGGSLVPVGGHNPYEPAHSGAAVICGPLVANFADTYAEFDAFGGIIRAGTEQEIAAAVTDLLTAPERLQTMRELSHGFAMAQSGQINALTHELLRLLPEKSRNV